MVSPIKDEISSLEAGTLDPAAFPHREHVRLGFEILSRYRFAEAAARMSKGLRQLAAQGGHPEIYNETITIAFLAAIAERKVCERQLAWPEFIAANRELLDKNFLRLWYSKEELASDLARNTFVLPRPNPRASQQSG